MTKRQLYAPHLTLGCDPELFFTRKGEVIGAERVIPKDGLRGQYSKVVIDGVQAEIHTLGQTSCRQSMATYLKYAFIAIHTRLQELGDPDLKVSFQSHFTVPREELDTLSDECKILGCSPSLNVYGFQDLGVDTVTFTERSAGGHLHFGLGVGSALHKHAAECVPVLDAILGNFCVMVDRDPYAAERRKVYGRAGEYRLPKYGLEYRTLSNFWLRAYPLQSMVMGIAKFALAVCNTSVMHETYPVHPEYWDAQKALLNSYVDPNRVRQAINENDLTLAKENWAGVKRFYEECVAGESIVFPRSLMPHIEHFLKKIEESGLKYWFNEDPFQHWLTLKNGVEVKGFESTTPFNGWESFLSTTVAADMRKTARKAA